MSAVSILARLSSALSGGKVADAAFDGRPLIHLPDRDQVLYVVGDVHGCLRQLIEMERRILDRAARFPDREHIIVFVGDLIDRGPNSSHVIDRLMRNPPGRARRIVLLGNHEDAMLAALDSASAAADWLSFGGFETLKSYGVDEVPRIDSRASFRQFQRLVEFHVPSEHIEWLRGLPRALSWREYFVTHAGVRPGIELEEQSLRDLIWIREPFLSSREDFGAIIVHGHTPTESPLRYPNRIAIDTGCYHSGLLSAAMLDRESVGFLTVSQDANG